MPPHANDSTPGIKSSGVASSGLAEAHRVEQHGRLRVRRVVDDLHHAQLRRRTRTVPVSTSGSRSFAQPGIDARREARHAGGRARVFERRAHLRVDVRRGTRAARPSSTRCSCPTRRCAPCRRSLRSVAGRRSRCSTTQSASSASNASASLVASDAESARCRRAPPRPCRPCRRCAPTARRARGRDAAR